MDKFLTSSAKKEEIAEEIAEARTLIDFIKSVRPKLFISKTGR